MMEILQVYQPDLKLSKLLAIQTGFDGGIVIFPDKIRTLLI